MSGSTPNKKGVFERALGLLNSAMIFICGCALVVLVVIFGWLVFGRYVLNVTPTWVEQLALLIVVLITFLMSAVGVREDWHLGVTVFRTMTPPVVQASLGVIADVALAAFGAVMMLMSWELVKFGWTTDLPMLNIPEGIRTAPVVVCGALTLLFAGLRAAYRIKSMAKGDFNAACHPPGKEADPV